MGASVLRCVRVHVCARAYVVRESAGGSPIESRTVVVLEVNVLSALKKKRQRSNTAAQKEKCVRVQVGMVDIMQAADSICLQIPIHCARTQRTCAEPEPLSG